MSLRYGVVGLGWISGMHLDALEHVEGAELVAVAEANSEKLERVCAQRALDVATYSDYRDLLADDSVDVVVVLMPTQFHREVAVAAIGAGKHVFCEKAMAPSLGECLAMIEARDRAGVKLMIGHSTRFEAQYITARELVAAGAIGQVTGCDVFFLVEATQVEQVPADFWRFRAGASGHGYVMNFGCHYVDTARAMTGADPVSVFGHVGNRFSAGIIPEDNFAVTTLCGSDVSFTIQAQGTLKRYQAPTQGYTVIGSTGMIHASHGSIRVLLSQPGEQPREIEIDPALLAATAWEREHEAFLRCIQGDTPEPVTAEDAMLNVEWALATYLSSERGCRVELPLAAELHDYSGPRLEETVAPTER